MKAARQVRGERVVEKILEAAVEELSQKGFGALSFEDVAARADVARTTIYRRWPTRTELAVDALRRLADDVVKVPDTGSLREDLMVMLKMFSEFASSPRGGSLMRMMMAASLDTDVAQLARKIREEKEQGPREVIGRAIARGELPRGSDPSLLLDMLFGAVQHYLCFLDTACTDEQLAQFVELVLVGAANGGAVLKKKAPSRARARAGAKGKK